jgi:hypothetical protein
MNDYEMICYLRHCIEARQIRRMISRFLIAAGTVAFVTALMAVWTH